MPITTYTIQPKETPKNDLKINLGLENNRRNAMQILSYMRVKKVFLKLEYKIIEGEYNGQKESTLVMQGETTKTEYQIEKLVNYLNTICTQDCISYKYNNNGVLQYNKSHKGQKQTFNNNYFLTF